jgi:putative hemolysin
VAADVALVLALVLVGGFFAAAEIALVSLRPGQVSRLVERGRRGRQVGRLLASPNRFLSAVQVGVTLAGFLSSAVGAVTLAGPMGRWLASLGLPIGVAESVALVVITLAVAYVSLVLGELAPKRLALQRVESVSLYAAPLLEGIARVARPLIWLLGHSTDLVVRLAGGNPHHLGDVVTEEELRTIVATSMELSPDERTVIGEVLDAGDRPIREVMVPRLDVSALRSTVSVSEAVELVEGRPFSRYPVVDDGGLDDVLGFVHLRDLFRCPRQEAEVRSLVRPVLRLPDSRRVLPALVEMRRQGAHLAVVLDEYGGGAGIVTLEDLIEELVGDITDEFDHEALDDRGPRHHAASLELPRSLVDAQLRLAEFAEVTGIELPEGPYDTAAGWLMHRLGRIPDEGDSAVHEDIMITVAQMRGRRIVRVRLSQAPSPADTPGSGFAPGSASETSYSGPGDGAGP